MSYGFDGIDLNGCYLFTCDDFAIIKNAVDPKKEETKELNKKIQDVYRMVCLGKATLIFSHSNPISHAEVWDGNGKDILGTKKSHLRGMIENFCDALEEMFSESKSSIRQYKISLVGLCWNVERKKNPLSVAVIISAISIGVFFLSIFASKREVNGSSDF